MKRILLLSLMFVTACPMQKVKQAIPKKFPLKSVTGMLLVYTSVQIKNAIDKEKGKK